MTTVEKALLLPFVIFALMFTPDIAIYTFKAIKTHQLSDFGAERIAAHGGWNDSVANEINNKMKELKLNPSEYKISHTEGKAAAPSIVFFRAETKYRVSAFDVLGAKMITAMGDKLTLTISSSDTQSSQIY